MEVGTQHHIVGPSIGAYARVASWREDYRRVWNGSQTVMVADAAMETPVSRQWKGYWHVDNRPVASRLTASQFGWLSTGLTCVFHGSLYLYGWMRWKRPGEASIKSVCGAPDWT